MKWIVQFCLILIFLCGISTGKSQDFLTKADSIFDSGDFKKAGLTYEWIIYKSTDQSQINSAIIGRLNSYKNLGEYERGINYIDQKNTIELPDSMRSILSYESLLMNYLSANYQEVKSRFLMSRNLLINKKHFLDSNLILCLSELKSEDWEDAKDLCHEYLKLLVPAVKVDSVIQDFNKHLDFDNEPKLKSAKTARILSMIIPGSGQIYAGYPMEGITSFGLHVLALGGAAFSFTQGLYVTGWIGGLGVLQKLYFGGNQMAAELTNKKNRLNKEKFIEPALLYLVRLSEEFQ